MSDHINFCKGAAALLASLCTFLFGGADMWLYALIAFVIIDYATGIVAAVVNKALSSRSGFVGILKKILYFAIVAVAHIVDEATNLGGSLRTLVIAFLVANEGISILENCARSGLPIPKKLMEVLEQIREKEDTAE
ncbi:MAG: phage holin family protein [Oscillospiraceae bacterium]|jgi:toxin secretion/phage lysis holin|nr:phage holin family protein [Oscillospiraceae bacterium]